jgi:hypothetical protein
MEAEVLGADMRYVVLDTDLGRDLVLGAYPTQSEALTLALRRMAEGYVDAAVIDTMTGEKVFPADRDEAPASTRLIRNRRGTGEGAAPVPH